METRECCVCRRMFVPVAYLQKTCGRVCRRELERARCRAYYERNRESCKAKDRAYRERNRESCKARGRAYYERNRESCMAYKKAYYAKNKFRISELEKLLNRSRGVRARDQMVGKHNANWQGGRDVVCDWCGDVAGWRYPSQLRKNTNNFCSRRCTTKFRHYFKGRNHVTHQTG